MKIEIGPNLSDVLLFGTIGALIAAVLIVALLTGALHG